MTYKEALETLRFEVYEEGHCSYIEDELDLAIEALEKQIPKKPLEDGYYDEPAVCPNCGSNVINEADNDYRFNCCYHCGQALDWSDTE